MEIGKSFEIRDCARAVFREVEHAGNGQPSWEEARAVAEAIAAVLGTPYTDEHGVTRPLTEADVLVVTPYNAQVRALRRTVPEGVRVGTVDKFQGQEAPVVLVSLASSSGEDAPRGISFVFNATGSTSRPRVRSAASSSSAHRGSSRRTARRRSRWRS